MTRRALLSPLPCLAALCLASPVAAADWPTYRHDAQRSGITGEQLALPLSLQWVHRPTFGPEHAWGDPQPKPIEKVLELPRMRFDDAFQVALSGEAVYFGSSADGKVYALDAADGTVRWEFYTDGPVRLAPTVRGGKVYVGSDDGKAYCLDARTGRLIWSFTAAPNEQMVLGNGRMISLWPIRTGVLVDGGVAYFAAGIFPAEGLYLYAVDAETGKLIWINDSYAAGGNAGISPQGYLVASTDHLFTPSSRSMPAAFGRSDGRFRFQRTFSWRTTGLFGGTYTVLAGDLLFAAAEQINAVHAGTGYMALAEGLPARTPSKGLRRLVVAPETIYYLDGATLLAADRKLWISQRTRMTQLTVRLASLSRQPGRLGTQIKGLKAQHTALKKKSPDAKQLAELARQIAAAEKKLVDVRAQIAKETADRKALAKRLNEPTKWTNPCAHDGSLILAGKTLFAGGAGGVKAVAADGSDAWSAKIDGKARGLAVSGGRLLVSSDTGSIYCFAPGAGGGKEVRPAVVADPFGRDELAVSCLTAAERIVREGGIRRGYGLILGGTGRLALELARRTNLVLYLVQPDADKAAAARKALSAAGAYGGKVTVMQMPADELPYADYFANLIVDAGALRTGRPTAPPAEVLRMLKPCGGVAFVGSFEDDGDHKPFRKWLSGMLQSVARLNEMGTRVDVSGRCAKITRGPLHGAGSWTHQYAEPGNTACGDDQLIRGAMGILWFGRPGPERMPSRHASAAAPLAFGGRMFVQGENVVMAFDAYNGVRLWQREISGALRLGLKGKTSNLAADDGSLFAAVGDSCLRLDAATGKTLRTYRAPQPAEGKRRNWDYVARVGELLYGSCGTDCLFAFDADSGELRWQHKGSQIAPITICIGDGKLFHVDRAVTAAQQAEAMEGISHEMRLDRRGRPVKPDVRLVVALDATTGKRLWARPQYVADCVKIGKAGGELVVMYANNVLLLCGQPWNGHFWEEFCAGEFSRRSLIALSGHDGNPLWSGRKGYRSRPLIVGSRIIAEPWSHDLYTGTELTRTDPITGAKSAWQMARPGHHCGNIAAAPHALFYRSGVTAFYDLEGDYGTTHFGAQRPGCWINCIPANGVVMMPEASSGCICPFSLQCTVVFQPRKANRMWGMYSRPGDLTPARRLAINFGAPGDRRDADGNLWLSYPRPLSRDEDYYQRLVFNFKLDIATGPKAEYFRGNADFRTTDHGAPAWVYSFGCAGWSRCAIPLRKPKHGPAEYTVRLHFMEPDDAAPGRRVFDVALQGRNVLKGFDVAKAAGGPGRPIVRQFKGIAVRENLEIKMRASAGQPLLCGVEAILTKDAAGE
jgi:outer membrane protein assembly factor BamB